jgi:mRNA-degrading endonuclease toxin of MazEF toxin-antitoxin module
MNGQNQTALDKALAKLKTAILDLPEKKQSIITRWIVSWGGLLRREKAFNPALMSSYKRGDVVYVEFGWNVGHEFGGIHYAVVMENENHSANGTIIVVPLTSLAEWKTPADVPSYELYLGEGVISSTGHKTVAKPLQMRAVSKMRIIKPLKSSDLKPRLTVAQIDALDNIIGKQVLKPATIDTGNAID